MEAKGNKATYEKDLVVDTRATGIKSGLVFLGGLALCFTGIGMLIGIPMMIVARNQQYSVQGGWKAICPSCDNAMSLPLKENEQGPVGVNCPICRGRVIFKNGELYAGKGTPQQADFLSRLTQSLDEIKNASNNSKRRAP